MELECLPDDTILGEQSATTDNSVDSIADDGENDKPAKLTDDTTDQSIQCSDFQEPDDEAHVSNKTKLSKESSNRRRMYTCATCTRAFITKRDLVTHQYMHRENPKFFCRECNKNFTTEPPYLRHMRIHMRAPDVANGGPQKKSFACSQCNEVFDKKYHLAKHHTEKHVDQKRFACDVCGLQFAWPENLRAHKQSHFVSPCRHECSRCSRIFDDATSLRVHMRNSHGPNAQPVDSSQAFVCPLCCRGFQFDFSLRAHLKGHEQSPATTNPVPVTQYVQQDIVNLAVSTQQQENPNEIIIEVYNYGAENNESLNNLKLSDPPMKQNAGQLENVTVIDQLIQDVHKTETYEQEPLSFTSLAEMNNPVSTTETDSSQVTSSYNPVSVDETGMCITVAADALPKLLDSVSSMPVSDAVASDLPHDGPAEITAAASSMSPVVQNDAARSDARLVWYAPPDDRSAMLVWYQEMQTGESTVADNAVMKETEMSNTDEETRCNDYGISSERRHDEESVCAQLDDKNLNISAIETEPVSDIEDSSNIGDDLGERTESQANRQSHQEIRVINQVVPQTVHGRKGFKSRPREPFMFNCVMTPEKPFVCYTCGEMFRWEISLNIHQKVHYGGNVPNRTGYSRCRVGRTRAAVAKTKSARGGNKSKSPVAKSRIVPRTASSDEEVEDEFTFHIPDEEKLGLVQMVVRGSGSTRGRGRGVRRGSVQRGRGKAVNASFNVSVSDVSQQEATPGNNHIELAPSKSVGISIQSPKYVISSVPISLPVSYLRKLQLFQQPNATVKQETAAAANSSKIVVGNEVINLDELVAPASQLKNISDNISEAGPSVDTLQNTDSQLAVLASVPNESAINDRSAATNGIGQPGSIPMSSKAETFKLLRNREKWSKCWRRLHRSAHICSVCWQVLTTFAAFRHHRHRHSSSVPKKPKALHCGTCSACFSSRLKLAVHKRLHHFAGFLCRQCGRRCCDTLKVAQHQRLHQPSAKPSECQRCGKRFFILEQCNNHTVICGKKQ